MLIRPARARPVLLLSVPNRMWHPTNVRWCEPTASYAHTRVSLVLISFRPHNTHAPCKLNSAVRVGDLM